MADEHPVISLLIARMESHPEEFTGDSMRWAVLVNEAMDHATPEDLAVLQAALSKVHMDYLHEKVMDELLNGEQRRAALLEEQANRQAAASNAKQAAMMRAVQNAQGAVLGGGGSYLQNYTTQRSIQDELETLRNDLLNSNMQPTQVETLLGKPGFFDSIGKKLKGRY